MVESRLRVIEGRAVPEMPVARDPWEFQALCVEAFVTSWRARGFSPVTIDNDTGLLERTLKALGRPAWDVTPEDIDRVVGGLAVDGRAPSTRRGYVQVFKGFHRFLQALAEAPVIADRKLFGQDQVEEVEVAERALLGPLGVLVQALGQVGQAELGGRAADAGGDQLAQRASLVVELVVNGRVPVSSS